jgi:hypothetical protein
MKKVLLLLLAAVSLAARSDSKALGTLTVGGKTTALTEVAVAEQADPSDSSARWLVILASDRKVPDADRAIARLSELAKSGQLHAVRILWMVGTDTVRAVPYDASVSQSGRMAAERPTLNLRGYGEGKLDAEFGSKMVGQSWQFHANVKAPVVSGGVAELEPEAEAESGDTGGATTGQGGGKAALGKLGYEYTQESFGHAVADGNIEAVRLFLSLKMSPNAHGKGDVHPMLLATQLCANQPETKPRSEVVEALTAAGGDVKAQDVNGSTPLLGAVQTGCAPSTVAALLKAGADPNAKSKGGATPLMFAEMFGRTEIADVLRKAGAGK